MTNERNFFRSDGHISDIFTAICSDRLREEREDMIPAEIRVHLENCEFCRSSVLDIYSATLSSVEDSSPKLTLFNDPEPVRRSFSYRLFLRTAATFLVLAFITGIYLLMDNNEPVSIKLAKTGKETGIVNSGTKTQNKELILKKKSDSDSKKEVAASSRKAPDPFKDNPNLEYMVDSPHRGRIINIISPEFRIIGKGKIIFKWENHIDKELKLKILNNLNETHYTFKVKGSKVEFTGDLSPGLYYWKLEDKDSLYHVGKFIIEK